MLTIINRFTKVKSFVVGQVCAVECAERRQRMLSQVVQYVCMQRARSFCSGLVLYRLVQRGLGREIKTAKTGEAINRAFYVGFVDQYFGHRAPSADRCR